MTGSSNSTSQPSTKSRIPAPVESVAIARRPTKRKYSAIAEPWRSVVQQLLEKNLREFIEEHVQDIAPMPVLVEKDVFVAMSGIVNARMHGARDVFGEGTLEMIKTLCLQSNISTPNDEIVEVLAPLQEAFEAGGVGRLTDIVEVTLGNMASARLKGDCLKKPSKAMSEGELVEVWSYVLNALSGHKLTLRSSEELELNNSEFKVDSASEQQVQIQYRKNLRINQAMMLYLREKIGMPLEDLDALALDVHGLSAVLFALKYHGDVFVSDLATKHMLRLPDSPTTWKMFFNGKTLGVLLANEAEDHEAEEGTLHEDEISNRYGDYE
ncbi:hypothetical protein EC991_010204 [Linnemannia zychae]|nr:hypothetical protein EC991_010204 [Linnemannia zychae]